MSYTPRTDALLTKQKLDNIDLNTSNQQLARLARGLEEELNDLQNDFDLVCQRLVKASSELMREINNA